MSSLPPHLQVRQYGAESKMAPGKQLAVLVTATVKSTPHAAIALALTPGMLAVRSETL